MAYVMDFAKCPLDFKIYGVLYGMLFLPKIVNKNLSSNIVENFSEFLIALKVSVFNQKWNVVILHVAYAIIRDQYRDVEIFFKCQKNIKDGTHLDKNWSKLVKFDKVRSKEQ